MAQLVSVSISGPDEAWLAQHTRELVKKKMVACGNIVPSVRSIYSWGGEVEEGQEALVTLHTQQDRIAEIIEYTNNKHPYETVQVVAVNVVGADVAYSNWVVEQTS